MTPMPLERQSSYPETATNLYMDLEKNLNWGYEKLSEGAHRALHTDR